MSKITIKHNNNIVFATIVDSKSEVVLKDLIEKFDNDLYKKLYSSYEKKDDVGAYWIEFGGIVFSDTEPFQCRCDMEFVLKCTIVSRDSVNTSLKYDGTVINANYLTFKCVDANGCTIAFDHSNNDITPFIEMSSDGGSYFTSWNGSSISLNNGDIVKLRGINNRISSQDGFSYFSIFGDTECSGSIMSLIDYRNEPNFVTDYDFYYLFSGCEIITPPELPAQILASYCYAYMFENCSKLLKTPKLPAETLQEFCYYMMFSYCISIVDVSEISAINLAYWCCVSMFENCSSIVTAPELPAMNLADACYGHMFHGCTSLTTAPNLPALNLEDNCYAAMFYSCTSLINAPELPAIGMKEYCYWFMFAYCTSLQTAPELQAEYIHDNCYQGMFYNCSSLNYIKVKSLNWDNNSAEWVRDVAANGTFEKPVDTIIPTGINGIPSGWTVINN